MSTKSAKGTWILHYTDVLPADGGAKATLALTDQFEVR